MVYSVRLLESRPSQTTTDLHADVDCSILGAKWREQRRVRQLLNVHRTGTQKAEKEKTTFFGRTVAFCRTACDDFPGFFNSIWEDGFAICFFGSVFHYFFSLRFRLPNQGIVLSVSSPKVVGNWPAVGGHQKLFTQQRLEFTKLYLILVCLSGPLDRLNAILSLLQALDRYRAPSAIGSAIGRPLSRPISHTPHR